ncbi:hypothetical protein KIN20_026474 [Parelaphostrongylus tenuis]|uniref:Uncharacterized protein n=1 Tax=Parelaphostrongylus tenuis TaxID=148309 RepID=A0AAD5QY22_PARTN|nr:hypothetical protein KIN20_026474 [Parelaphostrongylus tenuis]
MDFELVPMNRQSLWNGTPGRSDLFNERNAEGVGRRHHRDAAPTTRMVWDLTGVAEATGMRTSH